MTVEAFLGLIGKLIVGWVIGSVVATVVSAALCVYIVRKFFRD
jgi:hypothetical protein